MSSTTIFPGQVTVRLIPPPDGVVAVLLRFKMIQKNDFTYMVFLEREGIVVISAQDLLNWFDQERSTFLMDYVDPRTNFTGEIQGRVLNKAELERAYKTFEMYRKYLQYPSGREKQLGAALEEAEAKKTYEVEVRSE